MLYLSEVFFARSLLILIGGGLLMITLLGQLVLPDVPLKATQSVVCRIPGYDCSVRGPTELLMVLDDQDKSFDLESVNTLIYQTLRHSAERRIVWYENWLWWLVGYFFGDGQQRTQDPERLIRGRAALCGEAAMVMNSIADRYGLATRLVGLTGHVISEVKIESGWRVADPDYGVTYEVDVKTLEGEAGPAIMRRALRPKGYNDELIEQYVALFQSSDDNRCNASSVALSPRLYWAEKLSDYLKWIIPVLLLGWGLFFDRIAVKSRTFFRQDLRGELDKPPCSGVPDTTNDENDSTQT